MWGPQEYPKTTPHSSPPTSRDYPRDPGSGARPRPQRGTGLHTCVQGDVSRAYDLKLQSRQEGSPLGKGECGQDQSSVSWSWRGMGLFRCEHGERVGTAPSRAQGAAWRVDGRSPPCSLHACLDTLSTPLPAGQGVATGPFSMLQPLPSSRSQAAIHRPLPSPHRTSPSLFPVSGASPQSPPLLQLLSLPASGRGFWELFQSLFLPSSFWVFLAPHGFHKVTPNLRLQPGLPAR